MAQTNFMRRYLEPSWLLMVASVCSWLYLALWGLPLISTPTASLSLLGFALWMRVHWVDLVVAEWRNHLLVSTAFGVLLGIVWLFPMPASLRNWIDTGLLLVVQGNLAVACWLLSRAASHHGYGALSRCWKLARLGFVFSLLLNLVGLVVWFLDLNFLHSIAAGFSVFGTVMVLYSGFSINDAKIDSSIQSAKPVRVASPRTAKCRFCRFPLKGQEICPSCKSPQSPEHAQEHCPNCGYSVAGLPSLRCPECGINFEK